MPIISVINNKGGVGKTTTVQNLGVFFSKKGLKTALIDFDSQANLSFSIAHTPNIDLVSVIQKGTPMNIFSFSDTPYSNLHILPNNRDINSSVFNAFSPGDQPFVFKDLVKECTDFDIILVDTAPTLDIPTFNALVASDYVIIPVEYDIYSAIGLNVLYENITSAQRLNPDLQVLGILATQVHANSKMRREMEQPLHTRFNNQVFDSKIRTNTKFRQAQAEQQDIFTYEKVNDSAGKIFGIKIGKYETKGSEDIANLGEEILTKLKLNQ
jgi:chromosome partitioning protein